MDIRNLISNEPDSYPTALPTLLATTPTTTKRKLEDREELEVRPRKKRSLSPTSSAKPRWAESYTSDTQLKHACFIVRKKAVEAPRHSTEGPRHSVDARAPSHPRRQPSETPAWPAAPPPSKTAKLLGSWEPSINGSKPTDEMAQQVLDFLWFSVMQNPGAAEIAGRGIQFELEAKLGTLIDKDTNDRVNRGIATPCILTDTRGTAFRSSMTETQHKGLNIFLNEAVVQTAPQNPKNAGRVQIQYLHRREIDSFIEVPQHMLNRVPGCVHNLIRNKPVKLRVTYDQKTRKILSKIIKARVADLDLHIPSCPLDCRFSVNLEMDFPANPEELDALLAQQQRTAGSPDRSKDRLSYTHGPYQIDLTQVTQAGRGGQERIHELEIELASKIMMTQATRAGAGDENAYPELIEGWIDNVLLLARKTRELV